MQYYRQGVDFEDRLITLLKLRECNIDQDEKFNHQYKIDFVVTKLGAIDTYTSIGVQITTNPRDIKKKKTFLQIQRRLQQGRSPVQRALYIEFDRVDLERGGAQIVYAVLVNYQFDSRYHDHFIQGVRINQDLSFEFFDLEEETRGQDNGASSGNGNHDSLDRGDRREGHRVTYGEERTGTIKSYGGREFGWIRDAQLSLDYYFEYEDVVDSDFLEELKSRGDLQGAEVLFEAAPPKEGYRAVRAVRIRPNV